MDATRWHRVGLFISSTFDDMHGERDYLVKRVLPQLQEWCEERRLRLVDVDLRWGVVEPDMTGIVRKCLAAIDASQPLFLCLLGQRRGTVVENGATVTELELAHALAGSIDVLAYLREPSSLEPLHEPSRSLYTNALRTPAEEEAHERTRAWARAEADRARVYSAVWDAQAQTPELRLPGASDEDNARRCRGRLTRFTCDERPLSERLLEDLQAAILAHHPERVAGVPAGRLERELGQQEQVLAQAAGATIEREDTYSALDAYVDGDGGTLFALTGPSGVGKTTALAAWVQRRRAAGETVRCRLVGASDGSTSVETVLQSLLEEVGATPREPLRDTWLESLTGAVVVLDALDQLDAGLGDLDWLPWTLPEGVKVIVSFAGSDALRERMLSGGDVIVHDVKPFEDRSSRRRIVTDYLAGFLKELAPELVDELIAVPAASNPLYLKVVLSELRVFGPYASLKEQLDARFGEDVVSAFDAVLERMERDPGGEAAPDVFGMLACARAGLSVEEIAGALGDPTLEDVAHGLLRQVRTFTARRSGRYDFLHASFAAAARARYVTRERQEALAAYFDALPLWLDDVANARKVAELPFSLVAAGRQDRAAEVLSDVRFIEAKCTAGMTSELLADYGLAEAAPFAAFVRQESHALSRHATTRGFTLQHAYNWRRAGAVRDAAQRALAAEPRMWLRRLDPPEDGGPLIATLEGHAGGVTDATFAGSEVVSAGLDGTVIAWDATTWRKRERVVHLDTGINSCDVRGDLVALGGDDGTVRVHDRARNVTLTCDGTFEQSARRCRFLPDGRLLSVGRFGLRIHDPRTGELLHSFHGGLTIQDCEPGPDGLIALACSQADVNLYDPATSKIVECLRLPRDEGQAWNCRFSPDGSLLLAGGGKFQYSDDYGPFGECAVWDTRTWAIAQQHRFRAMVGAGAFFSDGASYAVGLLDGSLEVFDSRTGEPQASLDGHASTVRSLRLSPTDGVLVSASLDRRVRAWDAAALSRATDPAPGRGLFCAIAPDGRTASVWSGTPRDFDYTFRQRDYDLETATKVRDDRLQLDGEASHIPMFRHDPMTLLTGVRITAGAASPPHATAPVGPPGIYWLLASSARMHPFDLSLAPVLPEGLRSSQNVRWARSPDGRYALLQQAGTLTVGGHAVKLGGDEWQAPHLPQCGFVGERVLCISGSALYAVEDGASTVLFEGAGPLQAFCASGERVAVAGEDGVHVLGEGRIDDAPSLDCAFADGFVVSLGVDGVLRVGDAVFAGATALTAFAVHGRNLVATDTGGAVYLLALTGP